MAIGLLMGEAIRGEVEHLYQHDAESFIYSLMSGSKSSSSRQRGWTNAQSGIRHLASGYSINPTPVLDGDVVFQE
ncbi:hypothetical protein K503DRAFT_797390 [Rhizopogon vinicolor AM-OR11-026]|uniref:Uncharacterized protein n=1 Tax=Rhizopogon vinicolor AM-OR11-026 TaxID=1314800 RepID=A0A1B7NBH2_9AGAM|nr:hypothetical protein K503DRAFT_797390 [Rhizopogon vinicolor AM-OR11-026]